MEIHSVSKDSNSVIEEFSLPKTIFTDLMESLSKCLQKWTKQTKMNMEPPGTSNILNQFE